MAAVDFIELHAAHGYLLHEFVSPLSNIRSDTFGGQPLENRLRYPLRVASACRRAWPTKPLFVRISAFDWAETPEKEGDEWKQWGIEQSKIFVEELKKLGVDLIDCSSGGNWFKQKITIGPGYQVGL
jgi:2,4-dienoyl-CoA reductase-like NADH-dependent reductase (Old Yellow Enzyme family)